ncbi:MAG TPA: segregation/condensation protein A [Anaerolineaceae bacterium]|nr:segregation/condensation protein A [Anaerolineaceae bacterium]
MSLQIAGHQTEGYRVSTPVYTGPLDLLLDLIDRAELDITTLALAQVTDQYLDYLEQIAERDPAEVSAFLVIAARLVQIKSSALLPRPPALEAVEEIEDGEALARQLILYRRFRQLAGVLEARQAAGLKTYLRIATPAAAVESHLDLSGVTVEDLALAAWQVMGIKSALPKLSEVVNMPRVTIRERIRSIVDALRMYGGTTFKGVLHNRSRLEIVITFLAMLELIKRNAIQVDQADLFGEINLQPFGALDGDLETDIEFED